MNTGQRHVTLIGGGLAGSLLAVYMAKRGYTVDVYERRQDMRAVSISAGRSINLALSTRGIHALRDVGLLDGIMKIAIPMKGRMIHAPDGTTRLQRYGRDDSEVIYAVSRGALNIALLDAAERNSAIRLLFQHRCTGADFDAGRTFLTRETDGTELTVDAVPVIATDGSASAVRMEMQKTGRFNLTQHYLDYGYKELVIPAAPDGAFRMEKHALHIWPRGTFMLIALPNTDGSFTCTFFYPFEGKKSFATLRTPEEVHSLFAREFPDALALMPGLGEDFFGNPTGAMVTIRCDPWHVDGTALLLGDAAHAIVPFFGQGMNCAFEDCSVFDGCLDKHRGDWAATFAEFATRRKVNTDAIADMAVENFVEMRDLVARPSFMLKKAVEAVLYQKYPDTFIPKYSMVTFRRIPYAEALQRGQQQDAILEELCRGISSVDELDADLAERLIGALHA